MATAIAGDACENCRQVVKLESSIDGKQKLCKRCLISEFEDFKHQRLEYCTKVERAVEYYKRQIEIKSPMLNANLFNINLAIEQIEQTYTALIQMINQEKADLLKVVNDCKKDNTKFFEFKNDLNQLVTNINTFKDPSQNLYDDNIIKNLVTKFEQSLQLGQSLESKYANLVNQPIKTVEKYEKPPPLTVNKFLGNVYTAIASNSVELPDVRVDTDRHQGTRPPPQPPKPTLADMEFNRTNFEKWIQLSEQVPTITCNFFQDPVFLVSHRNYLFAVNEKLEVAVLTVSIRNDFESKGLFKIPIPNVRSVAVGENYFGVTYSSLDKSFLKKNKTYKPHGVVLYQRQADVVDVNMEKRIELDYGEFEYPIGIALDANNVYVCDKGLKAVFKIDIKTANTLKKIDFPNGEPYKLSVNKDYLIVTDPVQHELNVYDSTNLKFIKNLSVKHVKTKNGPFTVVITDDNTIFFKNFPDAQITMVDINLNNHHVFSQVTMPIQGFTVVECSSTHKILVLGCVKEKNKYKLPCYVIN